MASTQNEQDNRHYAMAAGCPMLEPADSQEAYDLTLAAFELSERWQIPVMLRDDHPRLPLEDAGDPPPRGPRARPQAVRPGHPAAT